MKKLIVFIFILTSWVSKAQTWPKAIEITDPTLLNSIDSSHFTAFWGKNINFKEVLLPQNQANFKIISSSEPENFETEHWYKFVLINKTNQNINFFINNYRASYSTIYSSTNGIAPWKIKNSGNKCPESKMDDSGGSKERYRIFVNLPAGQKLYIYQHLKVDSWEKRLGLVSPRLQLETDRINDYFKEMKVQEGWKNYLFDGVMIGLYLFGLFYNFIIFGFTKDKVYLYFGIFLVFLMLDRRQESILYGFVTENVSIYSFASIFFYVFFHIFFFKAIMQYIGYNPASTKKYRFINLGLFILVLLTIVRLFSFKYNNDIANILIFVFETVRLTLMGFTTSMLIRLIIRGHKNLKVILLAFAPYFFYNFFTSLAMLAEWQLGVDIIEQDNRVFFDILESITLAWLIITFSAALVARFQEYKKKILKDELEKQAAQKEMELERTKLIEEQKIELEKQVQIRTGELKLSLENLKIAQDQLVQSEKLASLGELTAGIAHEIQNPLNFVNNFAELNKELLIELEGEISKKKIEIAPLKQIIDDLVQNENKIDYHGKRAASIVKGMLQHSRNSSGEKELTNLNQLADEYLRLAYHGLRAKNKSFNADFELIQDETLEKIKVSPQEIGRVLLNIFNNGFHALEKNQSPKKLLVTIKNLNEKVQITVNDNGMGMTEATKNKIFQPFFTTKPTGEGTGLGLSMAYDIITKGHNGTIKVDSELNKGTTFTIEIPKL